MTIDPNGRFVKYGKDSYSPRFTAIDAVQLSIGQRDTAINVLYPGGRNDLAFIVPNKAPNQHADVCSALVDAIMALNAPYRRG